jgi:hypothetical protein
MIHYKETKRVTEVGDRSEPDTADPADDISQNQAAENTQESNLNTQLEEQQNEEPIQPATESPPAPPTRRSTRVRYAPNPLNYKQLGNPERFVSSVNATPTFSPFTYPQSYPLPPPAPFIPPPWFPPWISPFPHPFYPPVIYQCLCWNSHYLMPFKHGLLDVSIYNNY